MAEGGSMGFDFTSKYEKVVQNKLISYKIADERKVEVEFLINDDEVNLKHTSDDELINSDQQQKWMVIYVESFLKI